MTQFEHLSEKFRNFFGRTSRLGTEPGAGCRSARPSSRAKRPQTSSNNKILPRKGQLNEPLIDKVRLCGDCGDRRSSNLGGRVNPPDRTSGNDEYHCNQVAKWLTDCNRTRVEHEPSAGRSTPRQVDAH